MVDGCNNANMMNQRIENDEKYGRNAVTTAVTCQIDK